MTTAASAAAPPWTTSAKCWVCGGSDCHEQDGGDHLACATFRGEQALSVCTGGSSGREFAIYDRWTFRHVPAGNDAVRLLKEYFLNRDDQLAFAPPWDA